MSIRLGRLLIIAGLCCAHYPADAQAQVVVDGARMFRLSTLRHAETMIGNIDRAYRQRVLVETFERLPADREAEYKSLTRHERRHFFERWAGERARAGDGLDLYVLICLDPARVRVVGADQALDESQRMEIRQILESAFEKKQYDDGLIRGLERVDALLLANAHPAPGRWSRVWPWLLGLGAAAIVFWLLYHSQRLLRRKFAAQQPSAANDIGEPGVGDMDLAPNIHQEIV